MIAARLGATPYDLRIEGHTDNVPIHNAQFDSNWELSAARATHIARLFLEMKAIPADRLSAAGYAEFHPVASNDTPEGRAEKPPRGSGGDAANEDRLCGDEQRSVGSVAQSDGWKVSGVGGVGGARNNKRRTPLTRANRG
jgi:hypothetical protein